MGSTVISHVSVRLLPASKSHCLDRVTSSDGMGTEIKSINNNLQNDSLNKVKIRIYNQLMLINMHMHIQSVHEIKISIRMYSIYHS